MNRDTNSQAKDQGELIETFFEYTSTLLDLVWMALVTSMVFMTILGRTLMEMSSYRSNHHTLHYIKNSMILAVQAFSLFMVGFAFSNQSNGGILGQDNLWG